MYYIIYRLPRIFVYLLSRNPTNFDCGYLTWNWTHFNFKCFVWQVYEVVRRDKGEKKERKRNYSTASRVSSEPHSPPSFSDVVGDESNPPSPVAADGAYPMAVQCLDSMTVQELCNLGQQCNAMLAKKIKQWSNRRSTQSFARIMMTYFSMPIYYLLSDTLYIKFNDK